MDEGPLLQILRRLGISEFRRGKKGWLDFRCPLPHRDNTGRVHFDTSMSAGARIDPNGPSSWHCFACKGHLGNPGVAGLVRAITKTGRAVPADLQEMAIRAEDRSSLALPHVDFEAAPVDEAPKPLIEEVYEGLYLDAWGALEAQNYLAKRGLGEATAQALGLLYDDEQRRILFPIRDGQGRLYGFSGRAIDKEAKPKIRDYAGLPKRHLILGQHRWQRNRPVLIVEGLFGYAHLVEIGVERFINLGAVLGSVMTEEKAAILRLFDEPVYLLFDNDQAGEIGLFGPLDPDGTTRRREHGGVAMLLDYVPVYAPEWPEGKADPDELTLQEIEAMILETPSCDNT